MTDTFAHAFSALEISQERRVIAAIPCPKSVAPQERRLSAVPAVTTL